MNNSYTFVDPSYENFLIHYGTKGMKKGVRNYENYDGTLTPAGKERYSIYWTEGTNLKGKKVHYDDDNGEKRRGSGGAEANEVVRKAQAEYNDKTKYENPDGSLNAEGRKRYGDILTRTEMANLVRNYNKANGTNYKVGEVSFKKGDKIYTSEGKRLDEKVNVSKLNPISAQTKRGLFGREKELSYSKKLQNVREMSDEDLKRGIERSKLEKEYISQLGIQKSRGEKFIDALKSDAGVLARQAAKDVGAAFLKEIAVPKLLKTLKIDQETGDKILSEIKKTADQAKQAQAQTQNTQQSTQNTQSTKTKPIEQTSTADLRKRVQEEKGVSQEQANKMSRDEVIATLRNNQGSSGQTSTQSSLEQNKSQSSGQNQPKPKENQPQQPNMNAGKSQNPSSNDTTEKRDKRDGGLPSEYERQKDLNQASAQKTERIRREMRSFEEEAVPYIKQMAKINAARNLDKKMGSNMLGYLRESGIDVEKVELMYHKYMREQEK